MQAVFEVKAKSHFDFFVRRPGQDMEHMSGPHVNQITDYGYQTVYGGSASSTVFPASNTTYASFRYLKIGSATNEIQAADTGMSDIIATRDGHGTDKPAAPSLTLVTIEGVQYVRVRQWYAFSLGQLNNVTISQLGVFSGNNNTTLMCGQLLKDEFGAPKVIQVLNDEQLFVRYTSYWPAIREGTMLGTGVFTDGGADYPATLLGGPNHPVTSTPPVNFPVNSTNFGSAVAINNASVTAGNYSCVTVHEPNQIERLVTVRSTALQYTQAIESIYIRNGSSTPIYLNFSTPLPKTSQNTLLLDFKWTIKWRDL